MVDNVKLVPVCTAGPSTGYKLLLLFINSLALEWLEMCASAFVISADREAPEVLLEVSNAENPREASADSAGSG